MPFETVGSPMSWAGFDRPLHRVHVEHLRHPRAPFIAGILGLSIVASLLKPPRAPLTNPAKDAS